MGNNKKEAAEKLSDSLTQLAYTKRKEADILEKLAFKLDVEGMHGVRELIREYDKIDDLEIEAVERIKEEL